MDLAFGDIVFLRLTDQFEGARDCFSVWSTQSSAFTVGNWSAQDSLVSLPVQDSVSAGSVVVIGIPRSAGISLPMSGLEED
eukprot:1009272-Rhodomonas_salina.1